MNMEQAENILDAYLSMCYAADAGGGSDAKKAKASLREVILDAMTEYRSKPSTSWPSITLPATSYPTNWDGSPKVTCTGIDPAYSQTTHATVYANGHVQEVCE